MRLPRLIGFRQSLGLLISGQTLTGGQAQKVGIVDHLLSRTQSILKTSSRESGSALYDYQWLSEILNLVELRKIGNRPLVIEKRDITTAVSASMKGGKLADVGMTEDELVKQLSMDWEKCEAKAKLKFPQHTRTKGPFQFLLSYLLNSMFYTLAIFQLLWKVGMKMPAPFASLQTAFRCYYAGSWLEAMSLNALGLATLIVSAESKSLMSLFLGTRRLKKLAVNFGLKSPEKGLSFSEQQCSVIVMVSRDFINIWSAFVQGLLYNGIAVNVVIVDNSLRVSNVRSVIRAHFDYAVVRGRTSLSTVDEQMLLLSCYEASEVIHCLKENVDLNSALVIGACHGLDGMVEEANDYFAKVRTPILF